MKATPSQLPVLLVVDDDALVLESLEAAFEDDFQVLTAGSAELARELVLKHELDVVISDDRLPQESGVAFLGWLAQTQPKAVRILLTGFFSEPGDVRRAINQGRMWHYMRKPWDAGSMENIVNRALESKQQAEALLQAEERFKALFSAVPTPLFTADPGGSCRTWNPAFSELLQDWPSKGLSVAERLPPGSWTSLVARVIEGREPASEVLSIQAGGAEISAQLTLRMDAPDEVTGFLLPTGGQSRVLGAESPPKGGASRVLVMEQNVSQRRLLRRALERGAHEVSEAVDLGEALELLRLSQRALVLVQGGLEVTDHVHTLLERHPEQEVLFCTADVDHPTVQALATRGVSLLPMPYSLDALTEAVGASLAD